MAVLDTDAVEQQISAQFDEQNAVGLDYLTCPGDMIVTPGAVFQCFGEVDDEDVMITLELTNGRGSYTWTETG